MFEHRKSVLFPVVLIGLTIALLLAVVFVVHPKKPSADQPGSPAQTMDASAYRHDMRDLVKRVRDQFALTQDRSVRLSTVVGVREKLLQLRVPGEDRGVHLELAVALTKVIEALNQSGDVASAYQQFEDIVQKTEWLR